MRTLAILFTLFYFLNALAVAPYGFKGQSQSQTLYSNVLQAPNQLVTNPGAINALVETGNKNILANPSFEAPLASFAAPSWSSLGFLTNNITPPVSGQKAVQVTMTASALSLHQDSGVNNAAYGDGLQCLASVYVRTTLSGIFVSPRLNNVTSTSNMVSVVSNGKWALYKVPFICSTGANGIAIHSNSVAVTGTVDVDDAFVGAVDLQASVDASKVAGESYFATTTGCAPAVTSTTLAAFSTIAACPGPTIVQSTMGSWQSTDANGVIQSINDLPAGTYEAQFELATYMTVASNSTIAITDGTTTCASTPSGASNSVVGKTVSCVFRYASAGNRTFSLRGASSANTLTISLDDSPNGRGNAKFSLKYFGNSSVYSSTNADTDWASCQFSTLSWSGLGTVTNNLMCKRDGSDLLMRGTFIAGSTVNSQAQVPLPIWNGVQLSSRALSVVSDYGRLVRNLGSASSNKDNIALGSTSSLQYFTIGIVEYASTAAPLTSQNGNALFSVGESISAELRIPIEGWQGSNIIVGSFSGLQNCTSTLACTDTFSATISSSGTVVSGSENVDWINGNCTTAVAGVNTDYTCGYVTGLVTQPMNCVSVDTNSATNPNATRVFTSTSSQFQASNLTGRGINVICQKQGADYIGKTAMAVASDQNLRTPGITKGVVYSFNTSASGSVSNEKGDIVNNNCLLATSTFTCTFNAVFSDTPNCSCDVLDTSNTAAIRQCQILSTSSSQIQILTTSQSGGTTLFNAYGASIVCHGVSP